MIVLTTERAFDSGLDIASVRGLAQRFPGHETLQVRCGASRLTLGPAWGVAQCVGLLVALTEFGTVEVTG